MRTPWFVLSNAEIMAKDPSGHAMEFVRSRRYSFEFMVEASKMADEIGLKKTSKVMGVDYNYLAKWRCHRGQYLGVPKQNRGRPSLSNDKIKALCNLAEWMDLRYDIGIKAAFEAAASRLGIDRKYVANIHDRFIKGRINKNIFN